MRQEEGQEGGRQEGGQGQAWTLFPFFFYETFIHLF